SEAQAAFTVREAEQPVLAPAVRAAARVVVGKVVPAGAVGRVVLAHRPPLALGQVRAPALPVVPAGGVVCEAERLDVGAVHHGSTISSAWPSGSRIMTPGAKPSWCPGAAAGRTFSRLAVPCARPVVCRPAS